MDLRTYKTENAICEAFYELRRKMPLEKIRVNELCQTAQINKSTFYRHYLDIFDLSETLERELLEKVTSNFSAADTLYSDPELFVTGLRRAVQPYQEEIFLLYDGRILTFADQMEEWLTLIYLNEDSAEEEKITLSFLIGGAIHSFLSPKFQNEDTAKTIVRLLKNMMSNSNNA